jgi:hypothetical protein
MSSKMLEKLTKVSSRIRQVEDLKEQLRARNKRDQDISRRLTNGHNQIAQVSTVPCSACTPYSTGGQMRARCAPATYLTSC